jgi:hypothetical protein
MYNPKGQTHPQKNLPKRTDNSMTDPKTTASLTSPEAL